MQLKVTVPLLNKRNSVPASLPDPASIVGTVPMGYTFNGVPAAHIPNPDLGPWYQDADGFYYWGGGVAGSLINYQQLIPNVPVAWFANGGQNIKIAILDSGFYLGHPDLSHLQGKVVLQDFGGNGNTSDVQGHGTHILGLFAGNGTSAVGILGLVPNATYYLYKTITDGFGYIEDNVLSAINECVKQKVDVINMSFNVPSTSGSALDIALQSAAKSAVCFAAAGEDANLCNPGFTYPAQSTGVIPIGELSQVFISSIKASGKTINPNLPLAIPVSEQVSCGNDPNTLTRTMGGSSMATALISGAASALLSVSYNRTNVLNQLQGIAISLQSNSVNWNSINIIKQ